MNFWANPVFQRDGSQIIESYIPGLFEVAVREDSYHKRADKEYRIPSLLMNSL